MDPVTLEVVQNYLVAVAEEMRLTLMASARSTVLKEAGDLSTALTDGSGRIVAQARCLPAHLGVMAFTVKEFLKVVPASKQAPGDVYFTNDLAVGGNHLPDVKAITPVFYEGQIVAYAINLAHWPDIGGSSPGSYYPDATEIYQEGLQIPPIRLFTAGGPESEVINLIGANVRRPTETVGDIYAQKAANDVAHKRLLELLSKYGSETVLGCFSETIEQAAARMRKRLNDLPNGEYCAEDSLDPLGDARITARVRIRVHDGSLDLDFSGSSEQVEAPLNATYFSTCSAAYYALRALFDPDGRVSDGSYAGIRINVPQGTVLNPFPGAPVVGGNIETSSKVVEAIFRALAEALPGTTPAGSFDSAATIVWSGRTSQGDAFIYRESHGGGGGAGSGWDGPSGVRTHLGNTMNTPVEYLEKFHPIDVEAYELVPDSGGPGEFRGGLGLRRRYRLRSGKALVTIIADRCVEAPHGLAGGHAGMPCHITVVGVDGTTRRLPARTTVRLVEGDILEIATAGGGGFGPPSNRSEAARTFDSRQGYVSSITNPKNDGV